MTIDGIILAVRLPLEIKLVGFEAGGNSPVDDLGHDLA